MRNNTVCQTKRMMGQMGLRLSNDKFIHKRILSSQTILTHHSSHGHNFSYVWHYQIETLHTPRWKCRYHVSKYYILHHFLRHLVYVQFSKTRFLMKGNSQENSHADFYQLCVARPNCKCLYFPKIKVEKVILFSKKRKNFICKNQRENLDN